MKLDKLKGYITTLEGIGRNILRDDFDLRTTLTALIVIIKELVDDEIRKKEEDSSIYS